MKDIFFDTFILSDEENEKYLDFVNNFDLQFNHIDIALKHGLKLTDTLESFLKLHDKVKLNDCYNYLLPFKDKVYVLHDGNCFLIAFSFEITEDDFISKNNLKKTIKEEIHEEQKEEIHEEQKQRESEKYGLNRYELKFVSLDF